MQGQDQHGSAFQFTGRKFFHLDVPLGELRTDATGRLLVLGGHGLAQSRTGTDPVTFANNDDWCDDTSDGPVDTRVVINGVEIPVEGAWVVVAPPNYAPSLLTARTLYDLLYDRMVHWGFLPTPAQVSFRSHIRPIFERLTGLQWVNRGFAALFGAGASFNFQDILRSWPMVAREMQPIGRIFTITFAIPVLHSWAKTCGQCSTVTHLTFDDYYTGLQCHRFARIGLAVGLTA
ncbi:MAG: LodA/GoxA family CTQ-dependent oxidase [Planctomycetaceae bacterium]